jgi:hypothetical protein
MFNFGGMFQPQAARPAPPDTSCQASRAGTVLALSSFHPRWPVLSRAPPHLPLVPTGNGLSCVVCCFRRPQQHHTRFV